MKTIALLYFSCCLSLLSPVVLCAEDEPDKDLARFPVCLTDDDCRYMTEGGDADYKCFQYRCFPWNDPEVQGDFRSCKVKEDCLELGVEEEGDGSDGVCFKHQDKRNIFRGMCVSQK